MDGSFGGTRGKTKVYGITPQLQEASRMVQGMTQGIISKMTGQPATQPTGCVNCTTEQKNIYDLEIARGQTPVDAEAFALQSFPTPVETQVKEVPIEQARETPSDPAAFEAFTPGFKPIDRELREGGLLGQLFPQPPTENIAPPTLLPSQMSPVLSPGEPFYISGMETIGGVPDPDALRRAKSVLARERFGGRKGMGIDPETGQIAGTLEKVNRYIQGLNNRYPQQTSKHNQYEIVMDTLERIYQLEGGGYREVERVMPDIRQIAGRDMSEDEKTSDILMRDIDLIEQNVGSSTFKLWGDRQGTPGVRMEEGNLGSPFEVLLRKYEIANVDASNPDNVLAAVVNKRFPQQAQQAMAEAMTEAEALAPDVPITSLQSLARTEKDFFNNLQRREKYGRAHPLKEAIGPQAQLQYLIEKANPGSDWNKETLTGIAQAEGMQGMEADMPPLDYSGYLPRFVDINDPTVTWWSGNKIKKSLFNPADGTGILAPNPEAVPGYAQEVPAYAADPNLQAAYAEMVSPVTEAAPVDWDVFPPSIASPEVQMNPVERWLEPNSAKAMTELSDVGQQKYYALRKSQLENVLGQGNETGIEKLINVMKTVQTANLSAYQKNLSNDIIESKIRNALKTVPGRDFESKHRNLIRAWKANDFNVDRIEQWWTEPEEILETKYASALRPAPAGVMP